MLLQFLISYFENMFDRVHSSLSISTYILHCEFNNFRAQLHCLNKTFTVVNFSIHKLYRYYNFTIFGLHYYLPIQVFCCLGKCLVGFWRGYFNQKRCRRRIKFPQLKFCTTLFSILIKILKSKIFFFSLSYP